MSGYPQPPSGHGYGYGYGPPPPSQPYTASPPSQPYTASPPSQPYTASPPSQPYAASPPSQPYAAHPYGAPAPQQQQQHQYSYGAPPPKEDHHKPHSHGHATSTSTGGYPYASPFASLVPSAFPPGTDPNVVACFQVADQDGSGFIDDMELQRALSSYNQTFSLRTVRLLMYHFTNSNVRKIGPKEFVSLFYSLQNWRGIFERFDRDRSGKIDANELREALMSMGFAVSPVVLDLLVSKFDKTGGKSKAVEYDNFIECCLTVKGLTEKFKQKDTKLSGSATFNYEDFMITVLPFLIA